MCFNQFSFVVNVANGIKPLVGAKEINFDGDFPPVELVSGGAIFDASITNVTPKPVGSVNNFYSVGVSPGQEGPGVFKFDRAISYFGFLWGSVDKHNMVDLYIKGELVYSFTGGSFIPNTGDQSASIYVNMFANHDHFFNEIRFSTNQIAFEIDNAGFGTVPVPAALLLMASALGLFGLLRRKNKLTAA